MTDPDTLECPHGARCGGCAFLGVPYAEQLERKAAAVRGAFARYDSHADLAVAAVQGAANAQAYRARAKLVFGPGGELGLFERNSHDVVDIPECQILAPDLARVSAAARRVLSPAAPRLDGLDLRQVDDGVQVTLIAARGTAVSALKSLAEALCQASSDVKSVAASFRDRDAATLLGTEHVVLVGPDVLRHHLEPGKPYHLAAPGAFTQVHLGQANLAHAAIEARLAELGAKRVLELYAGSGALALRLSQAGYAVTAVEVFAAALAHAERAAREQALPLITESGPAERVLERLRERGERFDALLVNPPRRGLSSSVRQSVALLRPSEILYMSCEPKTLARDLWQLAEFGYEPVTVSPFDMIPHSAAVECLAILRSGPPPAVTVLYECEQWLAVFKSGYEPIESAPTAPQALVDRVRLLTGAEAALALPEQSLDSDSSGVCLFARNAQALPELSQAFRAGSRTFSALARGVTHKKGRIRRPVREAQRVTSASLRYEREGLHGGHSSLSVWPERAGAREVRQLLKSIGHPVLGDARFGDAPSNTFFEHRYGLDRSFLHCSRVELEWQGKPITIEASLPGELAAVLDGIREQTAPPS